MTLVSCVIRNPAGQLLAIITTSKEDGDFLMTVFLMPAFPGGPDFTTLRYFDPRSAREAILISADSIAGEDGTIVWSVPGLM